METTAKSASGLAFLMMASTSSPVPTGTVDLVTTTVKPSIRPGDLLGRRMNIGQVGMAVAAPRRGADRDEDRIGVSDGFGPVPG